MGNYFDEPSFEAWGDWQTEGSNKWNVYLSDTIFRTGAKSAALEVDINAGFPLPHDDGIATIYQSIDAPAGTTVPISGYVYPRGMPTPGSDWEFQILRKEGAGPFVLLKKIDLYTLNRNEWNAFNTSYLPQSNVNIIYFRLVTGSSDWVGQADVFVDDVEAFFDDQPDLVAKSTVFDFMNRLKSVILACDPNMGAVFLKKRRWLAVNDLETEATMTISTDGEFDDLSRIGKNVTRMWMMEPNIDVLNLTNGSFEFRNTIRLIAFFQREDQDTQEYALNQAIVALLECLAKRSVHLGDLKTGNQYMGYLDRPPKMITPVRNTVMDESGITGHSAIIDVTFYEEITMED